MQIYLAHIAKFKRKWKVTLADTGLNTLKGARIKRLEKYIVDEVNMITYGDGLSNVDINRLLIFIILMAKY